MHTDSSDVTRYRAFGGILASELRLPELAEVGDSGVADWTLVVDSSSAPIGGTPTGEDQVYGSVRVRGAVDDDWFWLRYDDTGVFRIARDGHRIVWHPPAGDRPDEAAAADVIGRVLALAMHMKGIFTLHASAVSPTPGRTIALMAPKGYGKSTLAASLLGAGARLVSDDAVPVSVGVDGTAVVRPGIHQVRLWRDSADRVGADAAAAAGRKVVVSRFEDEQLVQEPTAFAAAYVLAPVAAREGAPAVERLPSGEIEATMSLIEHSKVGALLGGREGPGFFSLAAAVGRAVPVYYLRIARDLNRLDEVVATMMQWHG